MAKKRYVFSEKSYKRYQEIERRVLGGNRQTKIYKKWNYPGSGGGGGGEATLNFGTARIITEVTGKSEAGGTITFGEGEAVPVEQGDLAEATYDDDPLSSPELNPDALGGYKFKIYSIASSVSPVGSIVHWVEYGDNYEELGDKPMKFITTEGCG